MGSTLPPQMCTWGRLYTRSVTDWTQRCPIPPLVPVSYTHLDVYKRQELIIQAIAQQENLTITDEEYQEGLQNYATAYSYESTEEFENDYGKEVIPVSYTHLDVYKRQVP